MQPKYAMPTLCRICMRTTIKIKIVFCLFELNMVFRLFK